MLRGGVRNDSTEEFEKRWVVAMKQDDIYLFLKLFLAATDVKGG